MEMRRRMIYRVKQRLLAFCLLFAVQAVTGFVHAQPPVKIYTIKDGQMYIWLSKDLPVAELDSFIHRYDLEHLALKKFIQQGFRDSIKLAGWTLGLNNNSSFTLTKPLVPIDAIINPGDIISYTGNEPSADAVFPAVSNSVIYGYNRFRNKQPFARHDSTVIFYLRNNSQAQRVMLAGSFNNWDPGNLPMTRTDSGWIAEVKLKPGKYWYKFIADGNWMLDNDNRLNENDGLGNTNSVFYVTNTIFRLGGYNNAKKVYVAGSFNNWKTGQLEMDKSGTGWELPVYLADGTYTYRFIADRNWMTDPANPDQFPNEYGEYNSVIAIGTPRLFTLEGYTTASKVYLTGTFNGWRKDELLMRKTATGWELPYVLGDGNYEYQFVVDGKAMPDPANPPMNPQKKNSILITGPNFTFRLPGYADAKKVYLAGEFNSWSPETLLMKRVNDEWVFTVHLSPGKHLYKFIVDGNWIKDPNNKFWEQNEYSTGNSVLWIGQ